VAIDQQRLRRAVRRRIEKEHASLIGQALALPPGAAALEANTRHLALMLRDGRRNDRASRAAEFTAQLLDATMRRQISEPAACAKGCAHCCTTYVSATIPEILRLARAVRADTSVVQKIAQAADQAKGLSQDERQRARITCPILQDMSCAGYAVRPLVCRSLLSKSAEICRRIFHESSGEMLPYVPHSIEARASVLLMLQAALMAAGLRHEHIELTQGLAAALAHPDAETRWLNGEPVFAHVDVDVADATASQRSAAVARLAGIIRATL
jgi:Fe-S-cluster containining protein